MTPILLHFVMRKSKWYFICPVFIRKLLSQTCFKSTVLLENFAKCHFALISLLFHPIYFVSAVFKYGARGGAVG
jgi:hypothetical protein